MKYKVGDRVKIKSLDWYNENKISDCGLIRCPPTWFGKNHLNFCGKVMTISHVGIDYYTMVEDLVGYWTDEMIECKVEEEAKPEPKFKVGDEIISDVLQLKWKVIDVERTGYKLISVNNSDLICDMDFKNEHYYKLVEEETKSELKFKVGDKITNGKVILTILTLSSDRYIVEDNFGECGSLRFNTQDDWKLVEEESEKKLSDESWKPSKEEMDVLYGLAYITNQYDEHKEEIITRLYQDLKREFFNGSSYENMFPDTEDDVRRRSTIQILEYARSLDNYNQYGKEDIDKNIAWLEKQGKKPQGKSALEAINEKNIDNQNCVKPTDRVEPKFKVGDKIKLKSTLLNDIFGVIGYEPEGYRITNISNGLTYFMSYSIEHHYELVEEEVGLVDNLSSRWVNEFNLPEGYIFKDENGNEIRTSKIILEKANTLKIQSNNMETETHRGYCTTEPETTSEGKKVAWFSFGDNDFADKVELFLSNRELIQEDGKWFAVKKKNVYPKTYKECCEILKVEKKHTLEGEIIRINNYKIALLESFQKLLVCRDAYWKLYGDEMGLGKPWEPTKDKMVYSIYRHNNEIETDIFTGESVTFEFPTPEMRDTFKENFDSDLEICKEFL